MSGSRQKELDDHIGFDQNLEAARKVVRQFGGDDLVAFLNESGLGGHRASCGCSFASLGEL